MPGSRPAPGAAPERLRPCRRNPPPTSWASPTSPRRSSCPTTTRARSSPRSSAAAPTPRPARRCCTCTASPTTSSRPSTPTGGRTRLRLLRRRPAQVRPLAAPAPDPELRADLREYFPELDEAWSRITGRDGHDHVVASGHSTGGLILPLWAHARQPAALVGTVLNSPWLDLHGSAVVRLLGTPAIKQLGARQPMREIPRNVTGLYARSLHRDHDGRVGLRPRVEAVESFTVYAGWLRAVRSGHAEVHRGLACRARPWCSPPAPPPSPPRWARRCTAPTSSSTSSQIGAGPHARPPRDPGRPSRAPATTSCSPGPRSASGSSTSSAAGSRLRRPTGRASTVLTASQERPPARPRPTTTMTTRSTAGGQPAARPWRRAGRRPRSRRAISATTASRRRRPR